MQICFFDEIAFRTGAITQPKGHTPPDIRIRVADQPVVSFTCLRVSVYAALEKKVKQVFDIGRVYKKFVSILIQLMLRF
jgi:hypothetical protein